MTHNPPNELRVKVYSILERCVEEGIQSGINSIDLDDEIREEKIIELLKEAVMNEICDYFTFPDIEP